MSNNLSTVTIGICAHNEEKNIGKLLQLLLENNEDGHDSDRKQRNKSNGNYLKEIMVVSSSTDKTNEIVENYVKIDNRVKHIIQKEREGKASAVNVILENASSDIIVLASADILIFDHTIDKLIKPFSDKNVGMTGGRPIPVDSKNTFIGYSVNLIWKLHHELALKKPKLGEIIAFRNIIDKIPKDTAVDEVSIESIIKKKGLKLKYVPEAIINNKGPSSMEEFIIQRRRIYSGHLHLKKFNGYTPSSMSLRNFLSLIIKNTPLNMKYVCWTIGAICLELYARLLATYDVHIMNKNPYIWKIAHTTKEIKIRKKK